MVVGYRDEEHYNNFVAMTQKDPRYLKLSKELEEIRVEIKVNTMILDPASPSNAEITDIQGYIDEIKKIHAIEVG